MTRRRRAEYTQEAPQVNGGNPDFRAKCREFGPVAPPESASYKRGPGEVPEWSIGTVSKTVVRASVPWVRIPPSPPKFFVVRRHEAVRLLIENSRLILAGAWDRLHSSRRELDPDAGRSCRPTTAYMGNDGWLRARIRPGPIGFAVVPPNKILNRASDGPCHVDERNARALSMPGEFTR